MKNRINMYLSIILIVIGLLVVFITIYYKSIQVEPICDIKKLTLTFFELLGTTLFTSGIFTIFLQLPDWQNYFEDRLKKIVLEQSYLENLDPESLTDLQVNTLKAFFKTTDIDREGSFLKYFENNIRQYINEPYREDVQSEINVVGEDEQGFEIIDRTLYTCRMIGKQIQNDIKWIPEPDEFIEIKSIIFSLKKNTENLRVVKSLVMSENKSGYYHIEDFIHKTNEELKIENIYIDGIKFSLESFKEDGLVVEIKATYKVRKGRFCTWSMAHPTKNFTITIHYPETCTLSCSNLLPNQNKIIQNNERGLYTMQYKEWLLPYSGVAYSFMSNNNT